MEQILEERDQKIEGLHRQLQNLGDSIIEIGKSHDREKSALKEVSPCGLYLICLENISIGIRLKACSR